VSGQLLHARMGHLNSEYLYWLLKAVEDEFRLIWNKKAFCETCVLGKQRRIPNRQIPPTRALCPGQKIHMDLCGGGYSFASKELQSEAGFNELPASKGGAKYFIIWTDDFSRFRRTVPLKKKSEAEEEIQRWILELEAMGMRTEALRRDGGREFGSNRFKQWLRGRGIRMEDSAPYTPE
jgi:Integrase core domain